MKSKAVFLSSIIIAAIVVASSLAYPPGVGILGKSENCLSCHVDNGNWKDGPDLVIDIVEKESGLSLKQSDGSFLLTVKRGQSATVLTVLGYKTDDEQLTPYRNGWLYVAPDRIESSSLSKFAAGWEINLPMACRLVGDKLDSYPDTKGTILPMTVRPTDAASDATVTLQLMLTKGTTVKGEAKKGMIGNYFERIVHLKIEE